MNINLTGKNALIGGSSKGLGLAIARQLAASGANVTLMARSKTTLKKVVDQLDTNSNQKHQFLVVNFSDFDDFVSKMEKFFSNNKIDILINWYSLQYRAQTHHIHALSIWGISTCKSYGRFLSQFTRWAVLSRRLNC